MARAVARPSPPSQHAANFTEHQYRIGQMLDDVQQENGIVRSIRNVNVFHATDVQWTVVLNPVGGICKLNARDS
jgi:hypothetical protein